MRVSPSVELPKHVHDRHNLARRSARILRVARNCVVELVGLEPTTRVLWNVGVSDQLTLSDTRHSSSKRAGIDGIFYNREIFGCRHAGMESPGVPRTTAAFFPPDGPPVGAYSSIGLPLLLRQPPTTSPW